MQDYPRYKNFKDEFEDKKLEKLFYKVLICIFIIYLLIFVVSTVFYSKYAYVSVYNVSMQSTLNPDIKNGDQTQDAVYIKYTDDIDYGDIVIIKSDVSPRSETIIKRALAFDGDCVSILKINNAYRLCVKYKDDENVKILDEEYVKDYNEWSLFAEKKIGNVVYEKNFYDNARAFGYLIYTFYVDGIGNATFFQVPENQLFYLGDNRAHSTDARDLSTTELSNIEGKVIKIVRNGGKSKDNPWWWSHCISGFFDICWTDILRFFGANV